MKPKHLRCAVLALAAAAPLNAEELRFDNAVQWRQWTLPLGIVELTPPRGRPPFVGSQKHQCRTRCPRPWRGHPRRRV